MGTVGEVTGSQLEPGDGGKDGNCALAYLEVPRQCDEKAYSMPNSGPTPAPLWRVQCLAESPGPGTFDAAKIIAICCLIPDPFLLAAAIAAVRSVLMPAPGTAAPLS